MIKSALDHRNADTRSIVFRFDSAVYIELFKKHIGPDVKIKAAGGVSTLEDLEKFIEMGCERVGTSRAVGLVTDSNVAGNNY